MHPAKTRPVVLTVLLLLAGAAAASLVAAAEPAADLAAGFTDPPPSARPWAYWWWLDGNASREGITRDLEEMKRQGIAGALVFDAGEGKGSPVGPRFMSAPWRALFAHTVAEADRLGLQLSLNLCSGWDCGGTWVKPKDACRKLVHAEVEVTGPRELSLVLPSPPVVDGDYRDVAVVAFPVAGPAAPESAAGSSGRKEEKPPAKSAIKHWLVKSGNQGLRGLPLGVQYEQAPSVPGEVDCQGGSLVDLSGKMDASGRLRWDVPPGRWTILRFGHTLLGAKTKCTSPGSQGYEIDFLSAQAMDMHFAATAARLLDEIGPAAGKTLRYFHDDSWEVGNPNWTPRFPDEFKARRGYDLLPYLPVLAGKIVDSREVSNRFLWDFRRTIGDCIADNHYGRLAALSHGRGIGTHPESGGPFFPQIDALLNLGKSDIPMGEFWARQTEPDGRVAWTDHYYLADTIKQAASAAHIYGKPLCQAEAFTTMGPNWEKDPFMLKDVGDRAFCQGLTRNVLCFYVHQPRLDIKPGYQWAAAGTHFDRNITWWNQIDAWIDYLSRCQFLLQQGRFVADVCYFYGQDVPNFVPAKWKMNPPLPRGYDCDTINAEVLLTRVEVAGGRIVLPDGMNYRMLVLPQREAIGVEVLGKIAALVEAGATVVGPRPRRATGLRNYPACDERIKQLAEKLWGPGDGRTVKPRRVGKGRVVSGQTPGQLLAADGIGPDFAYTSGRKDTQLDYIHRTLPAGEIYFVSNQKNREEQVQCTFRTSGKAPQLWDPDSGRMVRQVVYTVEGGRTTLPLRLDPRGSVFVVFRGPPTGRRIVSLARDGRAIFPGAPAEAADLAAVEVLPDVDHAIQLRAWRPGKYELVASDGRTARVEVEQVAPPLPLAGPWEVRFPPGWGAPASVVFEKLASWTRHATPGVKYFSGTATYRKEFDLPAELVAGSDSLWLDLGEVKNLAQVSLNGRELGVLWKPPFRVEVTRWVRPGKNRLEVKVTNLWPNRLIGDQFLPEDRRLAHTNVKKFTRDSPLMESGLLGPVRIHATQGREVAF